MALIVVLFRKFGLSYDFLAANKIFFVDNQTNCCHVEQYYAHKEINS